MNESSGPLQRILIAGGGAAGWMSAAYLSRALRGMGCTITLMESVRLGTSSVGEPADPALIKFVRGLRIDEADLMQQTSATYRLGTRFVNWMRDAESSWLPFGLCGGTINDLDLFHFWVKSVRAGRPEGPYGSYSLQALLAEQDKAPRPLRGPSPVFERGDYGYHLDTVALADFCRELATAEGVNHLFDDVRNVVRTPSGAVAKIETKSGRALTADLYLDCTPEGIIIERGLGDPWVSWSDLLLCDRVVVLPLPREADIHPYTQVTPMAAGWMRHVPLSHRVASSYCFASAHVGDDAAVRELLARASTRKASSEEPRYASLRLGRRQNFWLHNCIALGPAAGAGDPLVAADMLLLQRGLERLTDLFPDAALNPILRQTYNGRMERVLDGSRDFALLHYLLSSRDAGPFWQASRNVALPESLQALCALHDENGHVPSEAIDAYSEPSWHHLFAAAQRLPRRTLFAADMANFTQVCEIMDKMKAQNHEWLAKLPPHREVMEQVHRPRV